MSDTGESGTANPQLFARLKEEDGVVRADIVGPSFGGREAPIVSKMVQDRMNEVDGLRAVVLDFSDVTFVNSSGLGACIEVHNLARTRGADVVLFGLREDLCNLFKITRLDKLFRVVDDPSGLEELRKT